MARTRLNKTSKLIKSLVKKYGTVKLEVYEPACQRYDYYSQQMEDIPEKPYGMRYLKKDGDCRIRYWTQRSKFRGKKTKECCFFEEYSKYENELGDRVYIKDLDKTLQQMQDHDSRYYIIKHIYAGDWIYDL